MDKEIYFGLKTEERIPVDLVEHCVVIEINVNYYKIKVEKQSCPSICRLGIWGGKVTLTPLSLKFDAR